VRLVTWNVQQSSGRTLDAQVSFLAGLTPDLISVQEIYRGEVENVRSTLRQRTGQAWDARYAPAVRLRDGNRGTGVAVFATLPIQDSEAILLEHADRWTRARPALRVRVTHPPTGVTIDVYAAHLAAGDDATASRQKQVDELVRFAGRSGVPRLLGGDLNAVPTAPEIASHATPHGAGLAADYIDAWVMVGRSGGETWPAERPERRIDYWFVARASQSVLTPVEASVPDVCSGRPACLSDHKPVVLVLKVND
jgi:endonuclease/exonuclease/phosphatase family metal-dependent hydrolase